MIKYPLYTEVVRKTGTYIKVGFPSVWMLKHKYIYMKSHPNEDFSEYSEYIFLDGNKNNFSIDNIARVPLKYKYLFIRFGGIVENSPDLTRLHLLQAILRVEQYEIGEKLGVVKRVAKGRYFIKGEEVQKRQKYRREYAKTHKKEKSEAAKEYFQRLKSNPERYAKYLKSRREYSKMRYARKKNQLLEIKSNN